MALFKLGPVRSPNRRTLSDQAQPFSIDPSQLQVSLEQTQASPTSPVGGTRSSGKSSPLRGRCVKEYEEQLQQLHHENFNLKLRVFLLEERMGKALGRGDAADIIKSNIELKVENESLKKELTEKRDLLTQASAAIDALENEQRAAQDAHEREKKELNNKIENLKKELAEAEEAPFQDRQNLMPVDDSADLYAQAFGSFLAPPLSCNIPGHHSKEEVEELMQKLAELESNVEGLRTEAAVQIMTLDQMRQEAEESQAELQKFRLRVKDLETELGEQETRIQRMQAVDLEKETRIQSLTQELEQRHAELRDKEARIQTLADDLSAKEPEIEYKVQEIVEKDKLIEEKEYQLEQQNKILVEIQITLDEKQKQIEELESSLSERKKKIEELENSLSKAGRTLQGFISDVQKKEKEMDQLRAELKKKDKKLKDLGAELKEVKDMLNKAKWEAETSGREDNVKAMAEEENERLWAELEEKNRLLVAMEKDREQLRKDAEKYQTIMMSLGQKEEALASAEKQIAALNNKNDQLGTVIVDKEKAVCELEKKLAALQAVSSQQLSSQQTPREDEHRAGRRSKSKKTEGTSLAEQNSLFASENSLSAQATPNVQTLSLMATAETRKNEDVNYANASLLDEVARLRKTDLEKENEIEKLRKELLVQSQSQQRFVAQLPVVNSLSPNQHSASSDVSNEGSALYQEQQALKAQLAAYSEERKELKRAVEQLKGQLSSLPDSETRILKSQLLESQSKTAQLQQELDKLRNDSKSPKKAQQDSKVHESLRMYKREVAKLRKRLADSTNACDLLRIRLEDMVDVLEEILHMEDQGLLNLSNWSSKRRQALQHSISQSRELSRSLSQSLMIGVDFESAQDGLLSSSSMSASSWSVHDCGNVSEQVDSSRENMSAWERSSSNSLPAATTESKLSKESPKQQTADDTEAVTRLTAELFEKEQRLSEQQSIIDRLRSVVAQLEEQVKQRDIEIAWLNSEREKRAAVTSSLNKSVQTESEQTSTRKPLNLVSSTPYHGAASKAAIGANLSHSFGSPINNSDIAPPKGKDEPLCMADKALVTSAAGLLRLDESSSNLVNFPAAASSSLNNSKALKTTGVNLPPSESDAWSEPDRSVSFARIGLSSKDPHTITPASVSRRSRAHSASGLPQTPTVQATETEESSDSAQKQSVRKSRSDSSEVKKIQNKLRLMEQENASLRSQLASLVTCLRSTWDANNDLGEDQLDDSENKENVRMSDDFSQNIRMSITDEIPVETLSFNAGNVTTAQFIIDALQNRLFKLKESLKRKDVRLKESKEQITQLEFKVKEKYYKNCANELRIKEVEESLQQKGALVTQLENSVQQLEAKVSEAELLYRNKQEEWMESIRIKEKLIEELKSLLIAREADFKKQEDSCQRWEKSFHDSQNALTQLQARLDAKEKELIDTTKELHAEVEALKGEVEAVQSEKTKLTEAVAALRIKLQAAEESSGRVSDLEHDYAVLQQEFLSLQSQKSRTCASCNAAAASAASSSCTSRDKTLAGEQCRNAEIQFQRQISQMSDYVSDHLNEDMQDGAALSRETAGTTFSGQSKDSFKLALFPSPDLGIDSDPSRLPSLENAPFGPGLVNEAAWRLMNNGSSQPRFEGAAVYDQPNEGAASPTVEEGAVAAEKCSNCLILEKKYRKAKHTLAATLEKLRTANIRREKVDKVLNRELGKTQNILSQAREYLQQANTNQISNNGS